MDALNEVKMLNKRLSTINKDELLDGILGKHRDAVNEEDDEILTASTTHLSGGITDEELKEKFKECQKHKRLSRKYEGEIDEFGVFTVE